MLDQVAAAWHKSPMTSTNFIDQISRKLADDGRLIEAGWIGFRLYVLSPDAPPEEVSKMRLAFMAGSQHLFSSIVRSLVPGKEPTTDDLVRMQLIANELQKFTEELTLQLQVAKGSA